MTIAENKALFTVVCNDSQDFCIFAAFETVPLSWRNILSRLHRVETSTLLARHVYSLILCILVLRQDSAMGHPLDGFDVRGTC